MQVKEPPGFISTQAAPFSCVEWQQAKPEDESDFEDMTALIPRGMRVHKRFHPQYWSALAPCHDACALAGKIGVRATRKFILLNSEGTVVGGGSLDATYAPPDLAWLACWFQETAGLEMRLRISAGSDADGHTEFVLWIDER